MTHRELLEEIRRALGGTATQRAAELALHAVIRAIRDGLREDGEVKLTGFGSFVKKKAQARKLTHPLSGASIQLPPRNVIRFIPSSHSKKSLLAE